MYTLYKKELASFFSSLTGYLTIAVFLILTGLMLWVFKGYLNIIDFGYAGIDGLFAIGPYLYLFLIPAITMKLIAEERRGGTLETLMTHPLSDWTIVWAKFLAAWTLVLISLLPTLVYYFSVYSLGYPYPGNIDTGGVIGSYLGLLLLGGAFVSIGLFCSSLTKNQIVSFLAAAALCYIFYLGFDSLYDLGLFSGNTNLEVKRLGLSAHYDSISRGVVNTRDVVYFVGVIAIFVTLTRMVLQSRMWSGWSLRGKEKNRRRNLKMSHLLELCVVLIAVVSANVASHYLYTRFDLTAEKRYSLSDETKTYLKNIDESMLLSVFDGVPQFRFNREVLKQEVKASDFLTDICPVFFSKSEARKMMQGGGVSVNKEKTYDHSRIFTEDDLVDGRYIVLQRGKKNYYLLIAE